MKKAICYSLGFLAIFTGLVVVYSIFTGIKNQTFFLIASFEMFAFTGLFLFSSKRFNL